MGRVAVSKPSRLLLETEKIGTGQEVTHIHLRDFSYRPLQLGEVPKT